MNKPKIKDARQVCEALRARGVIVLAFDRDQVNLASYGETKAECGDLGRLADKIFDMIVSGRLEVWDASQAPK